MTSQAALQQAIAFHRSGKLADAERLYLQVMAKESRDATSRHLLGVIRAQQGRSREALELIGAALAIAPDAPEILSNYANVLKTEGRFAEALDHYDRALGIKPDYVAAMAKRALVLRDLGRLDEALAATDAALAQNPQHVETWGARAILLSEQGRHGEALAAYDRAVAFGPDHADLWSNRALSLKTLRRPEQALASVERALALQPGFVEALNNRGIILFDLQRMAEAIASHDRALAIEPDHADALNNRAAALAALKRFADSLADCDRALAIRPGFADALTNRGNALIELGRPQEALTSFEKALAADPDHPSALSGLANAALVIGDWTRTAELAPILKADVLAGKSVIQPFVLMGYFDDNELQLACARNYVRRSGPGPQPPLWKGERYGHDRIRVAYLSADFHQHVTAALTAEMFERHDRARFEITAVSFGPDDGSPTRARLTKAFDRFHDARAQNDREVAALLRQWEIDVAVDLGGHTSGARPWVLAHRPAPVQAKYMGYPGTSGCDFIDYIVADRIVVPPDQDAFFSEKIAALPDTLWVTDTTVTIPSKPTRQAAGLPEHGFVFCCFNHNWKITAPLFDIWMRLLGRVDGSVLWLLQGNATIPENLRREAAARGIDPARLIFAPRTTMEQHLARQQLADLFLDTLPYNAHTTASDALWAGLPLVTLPGQSFPARVAASILTAGGLPELIAADATAYEATALALATDPARLAAVRAKMDAARTTAPLFDTDRFTRNLEAAYRAMLDAV
jgi:predicted O-linked N-acetylglucosamine transferase (SPINDLY family)